MAEWQPIETAPKNTRLLVWRADQGVWIAEWASNIGYVPEADEDSDEEGWISVEGWHDGDEAPTHWQPLPAPPEGRTDGR